MKQGQVYNSTPKLCNSYCLFLDVLGFSQEIIDNHNNGLSQSHLQKFYTAFNSASNALTTHPIFWEYKIFTDNIVLGSQIISTPDSESLFGTIIPCVVNFQLEMVLSDFFIRGGWSMGDLYIGNNIVYGESLICAYEAESKLACYPRIVFTDKMMSNINKHLNYYDSPKSSPHFFHILRDEDDQHFINYLSDIISDDGYYLVDYALLSQHKKIIESRLQQHKGELKIYEKYLWTAQYHNYFCKTFVSQCPNHYLISTNSPDRNFQTL